MQAHQVMARGEDDAPLLDGADTGGGTAMAGTAPTAHLDKDHGAIGRAHDQVDFSTSASGRPIIALKKAQTMLLQVLQGSNFRHIADLLGGGTAKLVLRENH